MMDAEPSRRFGVVSTAIAGLGAALVVISFTALHWFDVGLTLKRTGLDFGDAHDAVTEAGRYGDGLSKAYFGWLAWALLIATLALAILAATPRRGRSLRALACLLAVAAIIITFSAIRLFDYEGENPGYRQYLNHASAGFYVAIAGFALMGVGGAMGPRRR